MIDPTPNGMETRYLDRRRIRALAETHVEQRRRTAAIDRPALADLQAREVNNLVSTMTVAEQAAFRSAYKQEIAGLDESLPGRWQIDPYAAPQSDIPARASDFADEDPVHAEALSVLANAKREDATLRTILWVGLGAFFLLVLLLLR